MALNLNEQELIHVINYLDERNYLNGKKVDKLFSNNNFINEYRNNKLPEVLSNKECLNKIKEYKSTNDKAIKDEIILGNIKLVNDIAKKYSEYTKIDIEELKSYGYEGLILAVDKYDVNHESSFKVFAIGYIRGFILKGIAQVIQGKNRNFYFDYILVKENVEKLCGGILDESSLIDIIIDVLIKTNRINNSKESIELARRRILLDYLGNKSLDDEEVMEELLEDGTLVDPLDYSDVVQNKILANDIEELLSNLTEEEKLIIKYRFGLIDGNSKTLNEIRDLINMSTSTIFSKEAKALHKLRNEKNNVKVKSYYDNTDAHKYGK